MPRVEREVGKYKHCFTVPPCGCFCYVKVNAYKYIYVCICLCVCVLLIFAFLKANIFLTNFVYMKQVTGDCNERATTTSAFAAGLFATINKRLYDICCCLRAWVFAVFAGVSTNSIASKTADSQLFPKLSLSHCDSLRTTDPFDALAEYSFACWNCCRGNYYKWAGNGRLFVEVRNALVLLVHD